MKKILLISLIITTMLSCNKRTNIQDTENLSSQINELEKKIKF
jgi:hypothetical protein